MEMEDTYQRLQALYHDISTRGTAAIAAGGTADAFLAHPQRDARMGVSIVFRIGEAVSKAIAKTLGELKTRAPELYYYPPQDFHVTVLDLLQARPGLECPAGLAAQYVAAIREVASAIAPFSVTFRGMIASTDAVLVKGYYEAGLAQLRQALRTRFREQRLPLDERYETFSCHVTAVRFPCPIASPASFAAALAAYSDLPFGKTKVDALQLVYHNWYDSKKTLLCEIPL